MLQALSPCASNVHFVLATLLTACQSQPLHLVNSNVHARYVDAVLHMLFAVLMYIASTLG